MACATSSSSASITGAVAAIAEPPHIEEPTPTRVEIFGGTFIALWIANAIMSEVAIVHIIIGNDCTPVSTITLRLSPNPSKTTAHWRIFFDVNLIPASKSPLFLKNTVTTMPASIAITAPPIIGNCIPKNHDGIAIRRQRHIPL